MVVRVQQCRSRDYSIDWKRGARGALFRKLYGAAAERSDLANEKREEEFDEQERFLKEQRRKDAEESKQKKV
jgi:Arc/MetJ family transcription regulator